MARFMHSDPLHYGLRFAVSYLNIPTYDGISVTVGAYDVSPHWVDQLKEGG